MENTDTSPLRPPQAEDSARTSTLRGRLALPSMGLRTSERRLLLFLVDAVMVNAALVGALVLWTDFSPALTPIFDAAKWFITLTVVWLLCALFFDCYDLARAASPFDGATGGGSAALATVVVYTLTPWLTPGLQSRGLIATFAAFALVGVVAWRYAYARVFVQPWFEQRALVVGAGWAGRALAAAFRCTPSEAANPYRGTGYELLGYVDDDPRHAGTTVEGIPVLGTGHDLVSLAERLQVDEVVLAVTHRHAIHDHLFDALLRCQELGYRVTKMSVIYERLLGRVPVDHVGRDLHMVMRMEESWDERLYALIKQGIDLVLAASGLLVLAVLIPVVALINAVTSRGPLFYRQRRVGKGGRPFQMLKFRSMVPGAETDSGAVWACQRDERITPAGRLLRPTRLDELPQVINVLRGQMSVIGPRPERPEFVDLLADQLPFYRARHTVRPGITGWAQIQFDYGSSVEDAQVKLEYDLYYVKHFGPSLDLRIALQTIPVMLGRKGC